MNLKEMIKIMDNESLSADIVEVIERGLFKTEHIFGASAEILGLLNLNAGKSKGKYAGSGGRDFEFERIFRARCGTG